MWGFIIGAIFLLIWKTPAMGAFFRLFVVAIFIFIGLLVIGWLDIFGLWDFLKKKIKKKKAQEKIKTYAAEKTAEPIKPRIEPEPKNEIKKEKVKIEIEPKISLTSRLKERINFYVSWQAQK